MRSETNYDIDGLVIKLNNIELQLSHGNLGDRPKAQIAWKFTPMTKIAKVIDVKWNVGNMRRITPIIHIEPTQIGGVIVSKMNCHNLKIFNNFKLYKGCKILFKRSNDVIPIPLKVVDEI